MKDKKIFLLFSFLAIGLLAFNIALAFTGPGVGQGPGSGGGILFSSSTFIGIGTTNPAAYLHLKGANIAARGQLTLDASDYEQITFYNSAVLNGEIWTDVANKTFNIQSDHFGTASYQNLIFQPFGGNVGIASSSPGYPLTVNGNVYSTGNFIGGLSGALSAANVTGPTAFGSNIQTTPPVGYVYAFPQALAVGTTTVVGLPTNGLLVAGDVKLADGNSRTITGPLSTSFTIDGYQTTMKVSRNSDPSFMLQSKNSGGTYVDRFDLGASGVDTAYAYFSNSNVGIGTASPGYKFTVKSMNTTSTPLASFQNGNTEGLWIYHTGSDGLYGSTNAVLLSADYQTGASFRNLAFATNGSTKMTIDTSGNVGIGTTTPVAALNVYNSGGATGYKTARVDSNDATNGTRLVISNTGNTAANNYGFISGGSGFVGVDKFAIARLNSDLTYSDYKVMVFDSSGNVGIATTTPQYKLSVNGSYYSVEVDRGNSGSSITIDWSAGNTQHVVLTAAPVTLTFTNPQPGARYTLILKQGTGGNKTVTWPGTFRTGSAGPITLSTPAGVSDYVGLQYNGVDGTYDNVAFNAGFGP